MVPPQGDHRSDLVNEHGNPSGFPCEWTYEATEHEKLRFSCEGASHRARRALCSLARFPGGKPCSEAHSEAVCRTSHRREGRESFSPVLLSPKKGEALFGADEHSGAKLRCASRTAEGSAPCSKKEPPQGAPFWSVEHTEAKLLCAKSSSEQSSSELCSLERTVAQQKKPWGFFCCAPCTVFPEGKRCVAKGEAFCNRDEAKPVGLCLIEDGRMTTGQSPVVIRTWAIGRAKLCREAKRGTNWAKPSWPTPRSAGSWKEPAQWIGLGKLRRGLYGPAGLCCFGLREV